MNVLIVTNQLIEQRDGRFFCIENVYDIIKRFSILGTLHLCACKYTGKSSNVLDCDLSDIINPVNIHVIKKTIVKTDSYSYKIIEKAVSSADLVVGYLPATSASSACRLAKKYKKKFLSYVVGCPWDVLKNHGFFGKILAPRAFYYLRKNLKQSDYALYVTEHFLQQRYPCPGLTCGCSDVKILELNENVLHNRLIRLEKTQGNEIIRITNIANYEVKYKGQHYVIEALSRLKKMGITRFHYHLIGGGSKENLKRLSEKMNVSELVHFEGVVAHRKIFQKLDEMDVYIQSSLTEGLPRSVVEAMSRGLLCICTDAGAMPEMIEPEYIVRKKSVDDIVSVLQGISNDKLKEQAVRNFNEAKKYEEKVLEVKRNIFFEDVKKDMML